MRLDTAVRQVTGYEFDDQGLIPGWFCLNPASYRIVLWALSSGLSQQDREVVHSNNNKINSALISTVLTRNINFLEQIFFGE
jgi:hypothetical protein